MTRIVITRDALLSEYKSGRRNFEHVDLSNVDLSKVELPGIDLTGADLTGATLCGANLTGANLSYAKLAAAKLNRSILVRAKLIQADLSFAHLVKADLTNAKLAYSRLPWAVFHQAKMVRADLKWANLTRTTLYGSNLVEASLEAAHCISSDFTRADLRRANLDAIYLQGVDLSYCKVSWNILRDSTSMSDIKLTGTKLLQMPRNVPRVPNLDRKIFEIISKNPDRLNMRYWHQRQNAHCRAGWAIALAGEAGQKLEKKYDPMLAAALIYYRSEGYIPDFLAPKEDVLKDIRRRVKDREPSVKADRSLRHFCCI